MSASHAALNRFGLGARPGEARALSDPRRWLLDQVGADTRSSPPSGTTLPDNVRASATLGALQEAQRGGDPEAARAARRELVEFYREEARIVLLQRVSTEHPYVERLVGFWSNHLCVSVQARQPVLALAGLYEREVIRPHVFGRFSDMLLASARHPAMLVYLDNVNSTGPDSPAARRRGRRAEAAGLNENYARELLELHSMGVDGGYGQDDVRSLARLLTGWTVERADSPGARESRNTTGAIRFTFRAPLHDAGPIDLLGERYPEEGRGRGERAIRNLAAHPSTARFISAKLARHFWADEPPSGAVEALSEVFLDTDGDLALVSEALVELDPSRVEGPSPQRKLRTPQDWVVASMRALDVPTGRRAAATRALVTILDQLRHPLWSPPSPKGFGDGLADWGDPAALMNRVELARTMAERLTGSGGTTRGGATAMEGAASGVRAMERLTSVIDLEPNDPLTDFLADESLTEVERMALFLGGPAFQWR